MTLSLLLTRVLQPNRCGQDQQADAANVTYTADGEVTVTGIVVLQHSKVVHPIYHPRTTTYTADGEELSIADGSVDIAKLKADDVITTAEQDAGAPVWTGLDDALLRLVPSNAATTLLFSLVFSATNYVVGNRGMTTQTTKLCLFGVDPTGLVSFLVVLSLLSLLLSGLIRQTVMT